MNGTDTVIIIGGSSGMGLAVAPYCLAAGASVVIAGRSPDRLHGAQTGLACPDRVRAGTADIGDRTQIAALFEQAGAVCHMVVSAADLPYGPVATLTEEARVDTPIWRAWPRPRSSRPGSRTWPRACPAGALAWSAGILAASVLLSLALFRRRTA
jgi:NAD(P)-dependent dehydrogenase (short-subunit alcohol dehydrogenase family)